MIKPVILTVDDDPAVLGAIDRDLRHQYRHEYRVMKAASPAEGLETAKQLAARDTPIAMFIVDQRMPEMSGIDVLREAIKLHPKSRRVLLTAYADTEVAIAGINEIGLDHYLMKPWDPPEMRLYPVLDDLLGEWRARTLPKFNGIRVYGSQWSPQSFAAKEFLSRNRVPYEWVDVDQDEKDRALVQSLTGDVTKLPVVVFPDGSHLVAPTTSALATKAGMQTHAKGTFYDVIVVGGGPAGLANAVYAASEGLRTVLVESNAAGGQAGTSSMIENYLGFPAGVTGADLAQRATMQARKFGAELLTGQEVVGLRREDPYRIVVLGDGTELSAYSVVITTGMSARTLEAPGVEALNGRGVYYGAAMTESGRVRDREITIVGGANSAGQGALFFSRYASRVTMLIRANDLLPMMSHYLADRIRATPNIDVVCSVEVACVNGNGALTSVVVKSVATGAERVIPSVAMFVFIGVKPHTDAFAGVLERDEAGFIITGADLPKEHGRPRGWTLERDPFMFETSIPGVFAAGDVRAGANRRVAAAVGEGSAAIYSVHRYLRTV
ncbi:MAG: fused response regulator/thioredoxin-disulfide reductase [Gemmatimonadetes bacterium]|nr:MAG: fused response regulator/thioredoxin-disulfide reductase [Gemmatimonadota bacterium]